jgi:hypothetical protein
MRPNDSLLRALVANPRPLPPPRPQALHVAPQQPLPANLRVGPADPSQTTNSPFSGGVTPNPTNLLHPPVPKLGTAQADFVAPVYQQAQLPARGAQNLPNLFTALRGSSSGATSGGDISGPTQSSLPTLPAGQSYSPNTIAFAQQNGPSIGAPQQTMIHSQAPPQTATLKAPLSGSLIAALAQAGKRLGSGGGSNIIRT